MSQPAPPRDGPSVPDPSGLVPDLDKLVPDVSLPDIVPDISIPSGVPIPDWVPILAASAGEVEAIAFGFLLGVLFTALTAILVGMFMGLDRPTDPDGHRLEEASNE